jgi:hypothetical protein
MANVRAIYSVGNSIVTYLRNAYPEPLRVQQPCTFSVLTGAELEDVPNQGTTLSLLLYRVTMDQHLRNLGQATDVGERDAPLSVDLHYLMTVWADSASIEQSILAWAMYELHTRPVLDASSLTPEAGWGRGDVVQIIPAELSNEDIMRIWDALEPSYRLSVSYIARVVRIELDRPSRGRAVVAKRFQWQQEVEAL